MKAIAAAVGLLIASLSTPAGAWWDGRLYGGLSAAAHVSRHDIVQSATAWDGELDGLPGPTNMTRYFPKTDEGLTRRSYTLHIYMIIYLVEELSVDLSARHKLAAFTEAENKALNVAIDLMAAEGMLEIVSDTDSNSNPDN